MVKDRITDLWDKKATQWKNWVGTSGDDNRKFNSDPVIWKYAGDVKGQSVLDAGCGTGYLSLALAKKGAKVVGVDISSNMIEIAKDLSKKDNIEADFHIDSCSELKVINDESIDLVISNYVLMDVEDYIKVIENTYRVLRKGGKAIFIMAHPCFDDPEKCGSYYNEIALTDSWGPFDSEFVYFHRPLRNYWRAFLKAGFRILDMDEPVVESPDTLGFDKKEWDLYRERPWSIAFLLQK